MHHSTTYTVLNLTGIMPIHMRQSKLLWNGLKPNFANRSIFLLILMTKLTSKQYVSIFFR